MYDTIKGLEIRRKCMIKSVFLDLDDTLLDFRNGERVALCGALAKMGIVPKTELIERYVAINLDCWHALERGEMTRDRVLVGRFERLFEEFGMESSAVEAQDIYEELLASEHDFLPGAQELLYEFRKSGKYKLYMATNGIPDVQWPRINATGIGDYYEKIFISDEIGYAKPSRAFFDACFEQIDGFRKDEAIIVGDSLSSDILGGINAGIKTCHFRRDAVEYGEIKPDYTINNLSELIPLLDSIK